MGEWLRRCLWGVSKLEQCWLVQRPFLGNHVLNGRISTSRGGLYEKGTMLHQRLGGWAVSHP